MKNRILLLAIALAALPLRGQITAPATDLRDTEGNGGDVLDSIETSFTNVIAAVNAKEVALTAAAIPATAQTWAASSLYSGTLDGTALGGAYLLSLPASPTAGQRIAARFSVINAAVTVTMPSVYRELTAGLTTNVVLAVGNHRLDYLYDGAVWRLDDTGALGDLALSDIADGTANTLIGYDASGAPSEIAAGDGITISSGVISIGTGAGITPVDTLPGTLEAHNAYWTKDNGRIIVVDANGEDYEYVATTRVDTSPLTVLSASVNTTGDVVTANLGEVGVFGAGGNGGFAIDSVASGSVALTYSAGSGSSVWTFTPATTLYKNDPLTLGYTQPTDGAEDQAGTDLATFASLAVDNGSLETSWLTFGDFEESGVATPWFAENGSPNWDNTVDPLAGAEDLELFGGDERIRFNMTASDEVWIRFRFKFSGNPPSDMTILDATNSGTALRMAVRSTGSIRVYHGSVYTDTSGWTPGVQYRVWVRYVRSTATNGVIQLWRAESDVKPGATTHSRGNGDSTSAVSRVQLQNWGSTNSRYVWFDDVTVSLLELGDFE